MMMARQAEGEAARGTGRRADTQLGSTATRVPPLPLTRRCRRRQGLPAPSPWARQTCSTGAVDKSSLSHPRRACSPSWRPRRQPDLQASGVTSLQRCASAPQPAQTQSCACCNLIASAPFSSPFRPFAAPPPIQQGPAASPYATLFRPCLIALTSPFSLCLVTTPCPAQPQHIRPRTPVCTSPPSIFSVHGRSTDTMVFCTYCGQSFTRDEHLERHILTRSSPV